jgi:hypothetical protein
LRAYLNAPDVIAHLRAMVHRRVPRQVVDDVRNDAIVKMCATTSLPIAAALGGWVETTTLSAVADYIRGKGRRGGREIGVEDIDERAAPIPEPPADRTKLDGVPVSLDGPKPFPCGTRALHAPPLNRRLFTQRLTFPYTTHDDTEGGHL